MQVWRRLRQWSMTFWLTLSSTPAHASIRRCIKSFTSCTSLLWTRCWIVHHCRSCSQLDWSQSCSAATNLEVYRGDHDHWDNCTFWVEAANDAQAIWVNTACGKEHSQKKIYQNWYCGIASYITKSLQTLSVFRHIILFVCSRRTSRNWCYIDVLIRAILNTKVSQGSVSTRLRRGGIH